MLTERDVVPYLIGRGLLGPADVVDSSLSLSNASRRNRNYKVFRERGPCYLLKQAEHLESAVTLEHEAELYRVLATSDGLRCSAVLPRFFDYDDRERVLVVELFRGGEDFRHVRAVRRKLPTAVVRRLGSALAAVHSVAKLLPGSAPDGLAAHPWILSFHRPGPETFRQTSSGSLHIVRMVQRTPPFSALLDRLAEEWTPQTFCHNDLRWDNCIAIRTGAGAFGDVRIVDWEMGAQGDPCWDTGTVLAQFLAHWLLAIPVVEAKPPADILAHAPFALESMHAEIACFWGTYALAMKLSPEQAHAWLMRSVRFAAAKILEACVEETQMSTRFSGNVVLMVQLSLNVLKNPAAAAVNLLGIADARDGS